MRRYFRALVLVPMLAACAEPLPQVEGPLPRHEQSEPTAEPSAEPGAEDGAPYVRGTNWWIVSLDGTAMPPNAENEGYYLAFDNEADSVIYDAGCAEQELAVSHQPGSPIGFARQGTAMAWCGTRDYVSLNLEILEAMQHVERWRPAGEAIDLVGTSTIRAGPADCTAVSVSFTMVTGDRSLEC
jgi:hypothetical protein